MCPTLCCTAALARAGIQGRHEWRRGNITLCLCVCSFTWVLFKRGELGQHFEGDDVPGYALYTATWGLIVPGLLERYPGNRKMAVQVRSPAPA